ncbi:MAG: hypothetical protein ACREBD_05890 [Blastocatellia bacterium]
MHQTVRDLLTNLIDYAGLFPPAALDMAAAARSYAAYRRSETSWMLGRFICPVARLEEFEREAAEFLPRDAETGWWKLSSLAGENLEADLGRINRFNRRRTIGEQAAAVMIDTIEIKASTAAEIEAAMRMMHPTLACYIEIPIANDPQVLADLIKAIGDNGARAKVRTGGVTADAFPSSLALARFIKACADANVPFKATAGLHHPLRSVNKLTYAPDSATAMMHGFLNVFLAAAFAQNGMDLDRLAELLEERSPDAFQFDSGGVTWRNEMIARGQLQNARNLFAIAFGSCSFEEPTEDLKRIGLL